MGNYEIDRLEVFLNQSFETIEIIVQFFYSWYSSIWFATWERNTKWIYRQIATQNNVGQAFQMIEKKQAS